MLHYIKTKFEKTQMFFPFKYCKLRTTQFFTASLCGVGALNC